MRSAQVHVYHGDGKGKTTAALGQALRAWGHGWRVLVVQFLKEEDARSGELLASAALGPRWRLLRTRHTVPVLKHTGGDGRVELARSCRELLERTLAALAKQRPALLVLDEILVACHYRFLTVAEVRRVIAAADAAGARLVVLTGHWAPKTLLRGADLVTELRKVRHPYDRGGKARLGIEF
jgi:cob(I)alamin adenosyltransferase